MKKEFIFTPLPDRLAAMPSATSGAGGRLDFYKACRIPFGYGYNVESALPLMAEWNAKYCSPAFNDRDVAKTVEAASRSKMPSDLFLPRVKTEKRVSPPAAPARPLQASLRHRQREQGMMPPT